MATKKKIEAAQKKLDAAQAKLSKAKSKAAIKAAQAEVDKAQKAFDKLKPEDSAAAHTAEHESKLRTEAAHFRNSPDAAKVRQAAQKQRQSFNR